MPADSRYRYIRLHLVFRLWFVLLAVVASTLAPAAVSPAPTLLLAERYHDGIDVSRYWVSEKLDGVRAVWDGKALRFRSGNPVPAPRWFIDALPKQPLDGELWLGRGSFDQLSAIVRRQAPDDAEWRRRALYDLRIAGCPRHFTDRIEGIKAVTAAANLPWLQAVPQFRLADGAALQKSCATSSARAAKDSCCTVRRCRLRNRALQRLAQADPMARCRGHRRRPPARQGQICRHDRRAANGNARRPPLRPGQRPERRPAPQPAAVGHARHLPLSRADEKAACRAFRGICGCGTSFDTAQLDGPADYQVSERHRSHPANSLGRKAGPDH
jgi:hypothetical protein